MSNKYELAFNLNCATKEMFDGINEDDAVASVNIWLKDQSDKWLPCYCPQVMDIININEVKPYEFEIEFTFDIGFNVDVTATCPEEALEIGDEIVSNTSFPFEVDNAEFVDIFLKSDRQ